MVANRPQNRKHFEHDVHAVRAALPQGLPSLRAPQAGAPAATGHGGGAFQFPSGLPHLLPSGGAQPGAASPAAAAGAAGSVAEAAPAAAAAAAEAAGSAGAAALAAAAGSAAALASPFGQAAVPGMQRITIEQMEGPSLGLKLKDRVITGLQDPGAGKLGFKVGQRIEAVNGTAVCNNDQLLTEIRRVMGPFKASGTPMYFDVSEDAAASGTPEQAAAAPPAGPPEKRPLRRRHLCC
ncbi:unnamed protein product [Prorocentrum cordatum]|uniref:PDZ domain-containing protein n=1 Tax=Prorocentrum cordatum TaxID=2364126 RepID=A0ABN9XUN7_9DINO|nr:unnamed protein product [Polarella glacialis]